MSATFEADMRRALEGGAGLLQMVDLLRASRTQGLTRAEAMQTLEALRAESLTEAAEDSILEVMDVVVGFCSPHLRVWGLDEP